ncbi:BTAD domain-containing putative transcriptional regulator [Kitasatospora sp. NPDC059463]|uniref:AfsR/SARP family transcriptional regulator n=1 Tax=unclassified Kitasatospora TaxID=2633591 RepID=UPI003684B5EE
MEFSILGPVLVRSGGQDHAPSGAKQKTILAGLLMANEKLVSDEKLSTWLWGPRPPVTHSAQIYTHVSRLRKHVGADAEIVRQSSGYLLRLGSARFDHREFRRMAAQADRELRAGDHRRAAARLRAALQLWRGPALADTTDVLRDVHGPQLEEERISALEARIDADLAMADHRALVSELAGLVMMYPLRERLRAQFMIALCLGDRQGEALGVFWEGRRILAEELGIDPGPTLSRVHEAVLAGDREFPRMAREIMAGAALAS